MTAGVTGAAGVAAAETAAAAETPFEFVEIGAGTGSTPVERRNESMASMSLCARRERQRTGSHERERNTRELNATLSHERVTIHLCVCIAAVPCAQFEPRLVGQPV